MTLVALGLLGLGVADLVRWSPGEVGIYRAIVAGVSGAVSIVAVAVLGGVAAATVLLWGIAALAVLLLWSVYDLFPPERAKPEYALALVIAVLLVLCALAGSPDPIGGDLATWYDGLGFGFTGHVPVDQFVLGAGAAVFALGTGNRLVRYALLATEASLLREGEEKMRGGRVLGPMERLIIAAAIISGSTAGAGFVIAAKGLLRFREIRPAKSDVTDQPTPDKKAPPKVDEVTEYFLIGTFASVLVAGILACLVLAAA